MKKSNKKSSEKSTRNENPFFAGELSDAGSVEVRRAFRIKDWVFAVYSPRAFVIKSNEILQNKIEHLKRKNRSPCYYKITLI